jgi:hypothetical protein
LGTSLPSRAALCLTTLLGGSSLLAEEGATPKPLDPGLSERVETRLVQFEVRVFHKGDLVRGLRATDFDIELGGKPLRAFTVDDMCVDAPAAPPGTPSARPGSFVFYFDDPELTVEGRIRAIEVARLVAGDLVARGDDVLIMENDDSLRTVVGWTHDPAAVSAALDRIAADPGRRGASRAAVEETQAEQLLARLEDAVRELDMQRQAAARAATQRRVNPDNTVNGRPNRGMAPVPAPGVAQVGHEEPDKESRIRDADSNGDQIAGTAALSQIFSELATLTQNELRRIERDIGRLREAIRLSALRDAPKGVVYFADTLRRDPGGAAVRTLASAPQFTGYLNDPRAHARVANWDADAALRALVRDASTFGVRFYSVEGRSLTGVSNWVRTAQDTLATMALDTGGLSFVNGVTPSFIADRVMADQSCWYLVSFAPSGWETDRTLALGVSTKKPGLRVQTRSALVIPSRATLTETRLIAAHFDDPTLQARPLSMSLYPVGGTNKRFQVLAQVRLPGADVPHARDADWDIGFEVVSGGDVVARNSSRVTWRGNGPPPVYQATLSLPAGDYEIIAVAREDASDSIRAGRMTGTWPPSSSERVTLSLTAAAQPQRGGIVLDGRANDSGVVVRGAGNPVDSRAPIAFVTAACVEGTEETVFRAERRIVGETEVPFAPMELRPDEHRCVQIRDLVAAHSLGAGRLTYFVRILAGDAVVASQELPFDVAEVPASSPEVIAPPAK